MDGQSLLSEREKEILGLVAEGLTNREIAQRLSISHNTVKVHLRNIFEKINVSSRTEATVFAIEHRIVDVPGGTDQHAGFPAPVLRNSLQQYIWVWMAGLILWTLAVLAINFLSNDRAQNSISSSTDDERWQESKPLPEPRAGLMAFEFEGDIFAVGGEGPDGISGTVFRYLVEDSYWETLNDKPTPVMAAKGVLIGEKFYIPGGETKNDELTNVLEIYDPRQDTWEMGASLPYAISDYAMVGYQGELFLFGGWDGDKVCDTVWIYDPDTDAWREGPSMQTPRRNAGGVEVNGKIVIMGGSDGKNQIETIEIYNPSRDGRTAWEMGGTLPDGVKIYEVHSLANFIFVVGRLAENENVILVYDVINDSWQYSYMGDDHQILSDIALNASNGDLIFLGGRSDTNEIQNTFWLYKAIYTISVPLITQ